MKARRGFSLLAVVLVVLMLAIGAGSRPAAAAPQGFITFEEGVEGQVIRSSVPGLEFSNTNGYDWLYIDCSTGDYNCPYPDGAYTLNGNIGAWLGTDQGNGRIDFTYGGAGYLSLWVSAGEPVTLTGYYADGSIADRDFAQPNLRTGRMTQLQVEAAPGALLDHVILSGTGNYWLIDDLSTDADGVPTERNPLIFLPGIGGSKLLNDDNSDGKYDEIWPNSDRLFLDPWDKTTLVLRLNTQGTGPLQNSPAYNSVKVGDILRTEAHFKDVYQSTVDYFTSHGYSEGEDFFPCPYDWRKSLTSAGDTLNACVDRALKKNEGAEQVDILAHSMGGLVARQYISDAGRAQKVERLITLGTPYLGAPKLAAVAMGELCFMEVAGACLTNRDTVEEVVQNMPGVYQIAPYDEYFKVYSSGFYHVLYDQDGDGKTDGPLSVVDAMKRFGRGNLYLATQGRKLMNGLGGWSSGSTHGVDVYMIVGDQHPAAGTVVEYEKPNWRRKPVVTFRIEPTNGDGTVPLGSATTRSPGGTVNLSPGVPVYYFDLDHGQLATDYTVLQFAGAIFSGAGQAGAALGAGAGAAAGEGLALPQGMGRAGAAQTTALRTEPLPLNGRYITLDGPAALEVFDQVGNRVGALPNNAYEVNIPGAALYDMEGSTAVFLPDSGRYEVKILGEGEAVTDVRVQKIINDDTMQTALYDDLPLTEKSVATLDYNPQTAVPGDFALDQDGRGGAEDSFPVTAVLDQQAGRDVTPPRATIKVSGRSAPGGWYSGQATVTLSATDNPGGTGVAKIEYTLDGGATVQTYSGPFTINADRTRAILAKATDRAGNEQSPLTFAGQHDLYLPSINAGP